MHAAFDAESLTISTVNSLSLLIQQALQQRESESTYPSGNADFSDSRLAHWKQRVDVLRDLRLKFEDVMAQQPDRGF